MKFCYILVLIGIVSCSKNSSDLTVLNFEKDLIPEGIAIDPTTETVFLNSLRKNKIVKSKLDGTKPTNFIEPNQFNYLSGFGMTIKGDTLFALGNSLTRKNNRSILLLLNLNTGNLIDSYSINNSNFIYLNDIAISSKSDIYITDSESNKVYAITTSTKELEIYLESDEIAHSNGIAISDNDKYLYLASWQNGIRIVEIESKKILNESESDYGGIDGMKYFNKSLIGIVNSRRDSSKNGVYRFFLDDNLTSIIQKKKLIEFGEQYKIPTTFDIVDGYLYFVINTQLDNFDQESNEIIDTNKLESYLLMKKKIE